MLLAVNRIAVPLALLVGLGVGFVAGLSWSRSRAPVAAGSPAERTVRAEPPRIEESLRQELQAARTEAERWKIEARRSVPSAPGAAAPTKPAVDKKKRAEEILRLFQTGLKNQRDPDFIKAIGSLDELDEDMTSVFVSRYREGIEDGEFRDMVSMLILLSGGKDAADWVQAKLTDPEVLPEERRRVLRAVGDNWPPVARKLPLDGPLSATADALARSENASERRAGASLLGGRDTENGRMQLQSMAVNDKAEDVREAAIASLGWAGDRATLINLRTLVPSLQGQLRRAAESAIQRLSRKYPD